MEAQTENFQYSYPELSTEGQKRTQEIIDKFQNQLTEMMNNTIVSFTQNLAAEITGDDAWIDLRSQMTAALCGYSEAERRNKAGGTYLGQWWVQIRAKILEENREAIINDIVADKELEIKNLKERINYLMDQNSRRF